MRSGHDNCFFVVIRMTRSIKIDDSKDRIYSSFERIERFDESVSQREMLETILEWYASELDCGWCMVWRIVSEREAKKLIKAKEATL
jgi:hypothetical protein